MRQLALLSGAVLSLAGTTFAQTVINIPMDQQINTGLPGTAQSPNGDAIYVPPTLPDSWMEFMSDETEGYTRLHLFGNFADTGHLNGYYYGPYIDFNLAGYGELYFLGAGSTLEFDCRFLQDFSNENPFNDAPIFARVYNYDIPNDAYQGYVDYGMIYQTGPNNHCAIPPFGYPEWWHVTIDLDDLAADVNCDGTDDVTTGGTPDLARISRMRFWGTDWGSGFFGDPADFIDVKNVRLTLYPPPCAGDLDDDGAVSLSDLAMLLSNFGQTTTPSPVYSTGFDGYTNGDLPGQDGWVDDTNNTAFGLVQVVDDPTATGHGKVMSIDPVGIDDASWLGAYRQFDALPTSRYVIYEWDQYRNGLSDNVWVADSILYDGWYAIEWDGGGAAGAIFPYAFSGGSMALTDLTWQHIRYVFDQTTNVAQVFVGADSRSSAYTVSDPDFDGIDFEVTPTAAGGEDGPIYIDNFTAGQAVALTLSGDYDNDGDVDLADLAYLLSNFGCHP